jgi:glutamate synthase domain-containing protein 3
MTGGFAYVLDEDGEFRKRVNRNWWKCWTLTRWPSMKSTCAV